jgi:hypothetical protein
MPTIFESGTDIAGKDYADFLESALDWFGFFSLVWRDALAFNDSAAQLRRDLERYETRQRRASHWPGTYLSSKTPAATVVTYELGSVTQLFLAKPGSLFGWVAPAYPEDLAFYLRDRRLAFATCTQVRIAWAVNLDFGKSLPKHLGFTQEETDMTGDGGFNYLA